MDDEGRRRAIRDFTFDRCKRGNQGFKRILLQLFGYVGHGKSSFINSAICVWSNSEYRNYANAASTDESHTTERLTYPLTKNIVIVDNRGCSKMSTYETGEIFAQLANLLPLDKPVGWSKGFELADRIVEAEPYVKASDFTIPIFVYSVKSLPTPQLKEELKDILNTATKITTVVPIVVLTHRSHQNYTEVETMFRDIGTDKFFAVENYTDKNPKRKRETHEAVIQFLYEVISDAQFRANCPRDADQELIDRKLLVLNYVHDREMMILKTNLRKQRDVENIGMERTFRLKQEEEERTQQKQRELHKERMESIQQQFMRQRLRDQFEHEQKLKEIERQFRKKKEKRKSTGNP